MKRLLLPLLLLCHTIASGATYNRTYTVGSGLDHATLALAEAAHGQDLVSNDSSLTFDIQDAVEEAGTVTIDGYTTDATHFLTVTTSGSGRHSGVYSTSAYRIVAGSAVVCLSVNDNYRNNERNRYGILQHQKSPADLFSLYTSEQRIDACSSPEEAKQASYSHQNRQVS